MGRLFGFAGATLGGAVGWWLGDFVGLVTAVMLSMVGTGVGLYAGRRMAARLLE
jgi:membrane protein YqaA with SNARE-associated domain